MIDKIISLLSGSIFGIGLVISGMTNPEKVIGFLSINHNWDLSLIFVMTGAIFITSPILFLLKNKKKTILGLRFKIQIKKDLDKKLLFGSVVFGIGWGLVGLCPGPAISSIIFLNPTSLIFLTSMIVGIVVNKYI